MYRNTSSMLRSEKLCTVHPWLCWPHNSLKYCSGTVTEVMNFLENKGILVAAIQETKLFHRSPWLHHTAIPTLDKTDIGMPAEEYPSLSIILSTRHIHQWRTNTSWFREYRSWAVRWSLISRSCTSHATQHAKQDTSRYYFPYSRKGALYC